MINAQQTQSNFTKLPAEWVNSEENTQSQTNPIMTQNTPDKELFIRKKRVYNSFIRLIKKGKFTSALLTAKALNIDKHTIYKWLNTKRVQDALNKEVENYVDNISSSKDWKAQAYLLDKATQQDKEDTKQVDITNLIQVNVQPNTPTTYIDTTS